MKGKALVGASVEVHGFEWTTKPMSVEDEDEQRTDARLRYVWVDVTISPLPRSEGFTHWEAGELMLGPENIIKVISKNT